MRQIAAKYRLAGGLFVDLTIGLLTVAGSRRPAQATQAPAGGIRRAPRR